MAFPNKFPGVCCSCGGKVGSYKGIAFKQGGKWAMSHKEGECGGVEKTYSFGDIVLDEYQQVIFDAVQAGAVGTHIVVDAKAGTGKTTLQCFAITELYKKFSDLKILCLAFGSADGARMKERVPTGVQALTTHSFCMSIVKKHWKNARLNEDKVQELVDCVVGADNDKEEERGHVVELLAKVQADAVLRGDHGSYDSLIESYELEMPEDRTRIYQYVDKVLELGSDVKTWGFTFDDALYFVATMPLPVASVDFVGVDECQDYNQCQLILTRKLVDSGARVMAVGDPNQSLFMFRGARHDSFARIVSMLTSSSRGATVLSMPVCRRCSVSVIRHAQQIVSGIVARPDAPLGAVGLGYQVSKMMDSLSAGDMVICRTNAPLIQLAWKLILGGKEFYMRGGKQEGYFLSWMADMLASKFGRPTTDVGEIMNRADKWLSERKCSKYRLAEHQGRVEVLKLIASRSTDLKSFKSEIRALFREPSDLTRCIVLSTIHRAKGSEGRRVFHLNPELCPHPLATTVEQKQQEQNALYVARTRAAEEYYETVGEFAS